MKRIANAEYAEIIIPASNSRSQFFFPDLPNLRGRKLDSMEFYSAQDIAITNSGYTPVAVADVPSVSVTLYYNSGEYVVMPLVRFRRLQQAGSVSDGASGFYLTSSNAYARVHSLSRRKTWVMHYMVCRR